MRLSLSLRENRLSPHKSRVALGAAAALADGAFSRDGGVPLASQVSQIC